MYINIWNLDTKIDSRFKLYWPTNQLINKITENCGTVKNVPSDFVLVVVVVAVVVLVLAEKFNGKIKPVVDTRQLWSEIEKWFLTFATCLPTYLSSIFNLLPWIKFKLKKKF